MTSTSQRDILSMNDPKEAYRYFQAKTHFTTGPAELREAMDHGNINIIDVRQSEDFDKEHVAGAKNLPEEEWSELTGLDRDKLNVIYCYSQECHLAARAAVFFAKRGYSVMEVEGGFNACKEYELPMEAEIATKSSRVHTTPTHEAAAH